MQQNDNTQTGFHYVLLTRTQRENTRWNHMGLYTVQHTVVSSLTLCVDYIITFGVNGVETPQSNIRIPDSGRLLLTNNFFIVILQVHYLLPPEAPGFGTTGLQNKIITLNEGQCAIACKCVWETTVTESSFKETLSFLYTASHHPPPSPCSHNI